MRVSEWRAPFENIVDVFVMENVHHLSHTSDDSDTAIAIHVDNSPVLYATSIKVYLSTE
jgi:hypothetical protein